MSKIIVNDETCSGDDDNVKETDEIVCQVLPRAWGTGFCGVDVCGKNSNDNINPVSEWGPDDQ